MGLTILPDKNQVYKPLVNIKGKKKCFVIVDDEQGCLDVFDMILNPLQYHIVKFTDPYDSMNFILENKNDIVCLILDIMLPKISGLDMLETLINTIVEFRAIPIILQSGFTKPLTRNYSNVHFLSKPYEHETILNLLRQLNLEIDN